jgi:hydrolethalus syndrome protein 1
LLADLNQTQIKFFYIFSGIRPRLKSNKKKVTEDAVQLYHKYQKEWNRFKPNFPGENDHSELRWKIRTKMLGDGN